MKEEGDVLECGWVSKFRQYEQMKKVGNVKVDKLNEAVSEISTFGINLDDSFYIFP